jgi:hypothetical protein
MNFFDPIPNADFQIGITFALLCVMFTFLYAGVKIINRIEELRGDMIEEDNSVRKNLVMYVDTTNADVKNIYQYLFRPLYEVGNTIWYNRGNDGKAGVFEDHKGKIKSVIALPGEVPIYLIKGNEATIEVSVSQSLITAWTN